MAEDMTVAGLLKTAGESTEDLADILSSAAVEERDRTARAALFEKVAARTGQEKRADAMSEHFFNAGRDLARSILNR